MRNVHENLCGNVIGSCYSCSHDPIEFLDFFWLLRDRATRKAQIEKVVPFVQDGRLCAWKIFEFVWTMWPAVTHVPMQIFRHFTNLTEWIRYIFPYQWSIPNIHDVGGPIWNNNSPWRSRSELILASTRQQIHYIYWQ